MGAYINRVDDTVMGTSALEKIKVLIENGATPLFEEGSTKPIQSPKQFKENLVCVVDNGWMGACGYAWDEKEFKAFLPTKSDTRPRYWFIFDRAKEFAEPKYWEDNN